MFRKIWRGWIIDHLKQINLLDNNSKLETKFEDISHREVIRKVRFTTIVDLPFISPVMFPAATMAQSKASILVQIQAVSYRVLLVLVIIATVN